MRITCGETAKNSAPMISAIIPTIDNIVLVVISPCLIVILGRFN
jgi:hypothetical protein